MNIIAPSILAANFADLTNEIQDVEKAGADWIHIDIMDGHFVPNITIGPVVVKSIRKITSLPFDVHLMITSPEDFIDDFIDAGANRITVHVEACKHLHRVITKIKERGIQAGIALNPATPLSSIETLLFEYIDLVLVMTVNPGFGGQSFIPMTLSKIKQLHAMRSQDSSHQYLIQVDGGIEPHTAKLVVDSGADVLVAGNAIFGQKNRFAAIQQIKNAIAK